MKALKWIKENVATTVALGCLAFIVGSFPFIQYKYNQHAAACEAAGGVYFSGRSAFICLDPSAIKTLKENK